MKKTVIFTIAILTNISLFAQDAYEINDIAEDFKLTNIDDKQVSMSDFDEAKGFIVIFTCNHCPYSVLYEDRIIALDKKYKTMGYPVIAINPNDPDKQPEDSFENMKKRAEEKGFTFPYLFDEGQTVYPKYGATRTPHVFLLNKENNKLVVKYIGAFDDNAKNEKDVEKRYLENAINALLKGENPDPNFTKAIGCSIKVNS